MKIRGDILFKKKHKWTKHNKVMIIVTVVLVTFSVLSLTIHRSASNLEMMFRDSIANIEYYVIKAPIQYISNLWNEYIEMKDVYEENKKLKEQSDNLVRESAMNEVFSSEIEALKKQLNINCLPTDYQIKNTYIVQRNAESWNNEVTINLGQLSGVENGMAVITSEGMIGTITNAGEISSTVSLLSSENYISQLPIMIISDNQEYYGLLNRYDLNTKSYRVTLFSDVEKIEKGAKVVTSGLGGKGKSPRGILIGTVEEFSMGDDTTESVCKVKPSVDFNSLNYVAVVQRVNEE